jgi:hypothetical protein
VPTKERKSSLDFQQEGRMAEHDQSREIPIDAELPGEKGKPVTEDHTEEPTEMQDGGE